MQPQSSFPANTMFRKQSGISVKKLTGDENPKFVKFNEEMKEFKETLLWDVQFFDFNSLIFS